MDIVIIASVCFILRNSTFLSYGSLLKYETGSSLKCHITGIPSFFALLIPTGEIPVFIWRRSTFSCFKIFKIWISLLNERTRLTRIFISSTIPLPFSHEKNKHLKTGIFLSSSLVSNVPLDPVMTITSKFPSSMSLSMISSIAKVAPLIFENNETNAILIFLFFSVLFTVVSLILTNSFLLIQHQLHT